MTEIKYHRVRTALGAVVVVGAFLFVSGAPLAAKDFPPAIAKLIPQAKKEGQIKMAWTALGFKKGADRFIAGFNKYYGLNHKVLFTPTPGFAAQTRRLAQEYAAGKPAFRDFSLIAGSPQVRFELGNKTSVPIDWAAMVPTIKADFLNNVLASPDKSLLTFISQAPTIMYNSNMIKPADAPKTFADLLNPKWKGMIASTPYAANFEDLRSHPIWKGQKAYDFVSRFAAQLSGLILCAELDRVATGEFPIFVTTCEPGLVRKKIAQGAPVAQNIPLDWRVVVHWYLGVPKHAVNKASAQLFIAWLMRPEGQAVLWQNEGADLHYLPGSRQKGLIDAVERESGKKMIVETIRKQITYKNQDFKTWVLGQFRGSVPKKKK